MKIIADESVNYLFVSKLRQKGFEVLSVAENYPSIEDEAILSISLHPQSIVITEDKDFGELVFKHKKEFIAVILLRYDAPETKIILEQLIQILEKNFKELINAFVVITAQRTRIKYL